MGATLNPSGASRAQPEPEINVTPLVDVVLVLLIIFMVIAPAINEGEQVELPAILRPDPKPKDLHPIDVTVALNGRVLVDKEPVERSSLERKLRELHTADPERELLLKTDTKMPYRTVRGVLAELQGIGFKGLSLKVTERKAQPGS